MKQNISTKIMDDVSVEFHVCREGHVSFGCTNGWIMNPYAVFIWNKRGFGETIYRSPELETVKRTENSVSYIIANETRRSVTQSQNGVDFIIAGFTFEYHGGINFLNRFRVAAELPEKIQEQMRVILAELADSENSERPNYHKTIIRKKAGYSLLALLLECAEEREFPEADWTRLAPAVQYLNRHYREPFDIERIVRLTPYSRVHFYRIFRTRFHVAPQEYAVLLRIRDAARLLLDTDLSVAEIGCKIGWENPFYFSRIFKRITGVPPLHYRKNPIEFSVQNKSC